MKILCVVGARPNFMKMAAVIKALDARSEFQTYLVHTGQHYDDVLSGQFFRELNIPLPDVNLGIGSSSHAVQTAQIMEAFEPILINENPRAVLVVGDVNSALACSLVSVKLEIPVIHVESGLRSNDRTMPEEINRLIVDAISSIHFCTEQSGVDNLISEGVNKQKIFLVGNVMIDTLLANVKFAEKSLILETLSLTEKSYGVVTLHRPANVDNPSVLSQILEALAVIQRDMELIMPVHPRTVDKLNSGENKQIISKMKNLHLIDPLGYLDFMKLMSNASVILTDSGGIQEESTILGIPCLTLRENTERPVTIAMGTNKLAGTTTCGIINAYKNIVKDSDKHFDVPPLWDGQANIRIAQILLEEFQNGFSIQ